MLRPFFWPLAHLAFDGPWVNAVAARVQLFLGNLAEQVAIPALPTATLTWAFGQSATQDLQRAGEREAARRQLLDLGGFKHQLAHHVVGEQEAVDLLDHPGRGGPGDL